MDRNRNLDSATPSSASTGSRPSSSVTELKHILSVTYGGLFTSTIVNKADSSLWERLWDDCFRGRDPARIVRALRLCLQRHSRPWTPADFIAAYAETATPPAYRVNTEALALPHETRAEQLARGARQARALLRQLREDARDRPGPAGPAASARAGVSEAPAHPLSGRGAVPAPIDG
jgi:hypothetical protein